MTEWEEQENSGIWIPEKEGDQIEGLVEKKDEGNYGPQWTIITADESIRTPSHKVLQNRMGNVKEGDTVRITFVGEEPPAVKGQNPTKMYKVEKAKQ